MGGGSVGVAADSGALAAQRGAGHLLDDVFDGCFRHADDRIGVGDPDRTDVAADESGLVGDRADEVARADAGLASEADVDEPRTGAGVLALRAAAITLAGVALLVLVELLGVALAPAQAVGRVGDLEFVDRRARVTRARA